MKSAIYLFCASYQQVTSKLKSTMSQVKCHQQTRNRFHFCPRNWIKSRKDCQYTVNVCRQRLIFRQIFYNVCILLGVFLHFLQFHGTKNNAVVWATSVLRPRNSSMQQFSRVWVHRGICFFRDWQNGCRSALFSVSVPSPWAVLSFKPWAVKICLYSLLFVRGCNW